MGRFYRIQGEHAAWVEHNFGTPRPSWQPVLGIVEELGELEEALMAQTPDEQWCAAVTDAIGDVAIYMMDLCTVQGLDFETDVWSFLAWASTTRWPPCELVSSPPSAKTLTRSWRSWSSRRRSAKRASDSACPTTRRASASRGRSCAFANISRPACPSCEWAGALERASRQEAAAASDGTQLFAVYRRERNTNRNKEQ